MSGYPRQRDHGLHRSLAGMFGAAFLLAAMPISAADPDQVFFPEDSQPVAVSPTPLRETPAESVSFQESAASSTPYDQTYAPPTMTVAPPSPYAGSLWERPVLTGNWGGARDSIAANGIIFSASSTNYYQSIASGGINQFSAYSGRDDLFVKVDGEKAGLWKGAFIDLHAESRYGDTVNNGTGAIIPVNTGGLFPSPKGSVTSLTAVKFTQALSESFVVFSGKINMLDELRQAYSGGRGVDGFMNTGIVFPMAAARTVPYSSLGAGFAVLSDMYPIFSFTVLDTQNSPVSSGFDNFLQNGVTMIGKVDVPVTVRGLPGHQGIWGTYSTGTYTDLNPTPYFDPSYGLVVVTGQQVGSWSLFYSGDQALYVDPNNPQRHWGLFSNIGLADNGPSPIRWSANVGLGGSSPIVSRPLDTFGVGYSYVGYSSPIKNLAPALLPIQDDHAVELFYNYAVTPWFHLTPDMQIVTPALERTPFDGRQSINTALVLALRAKIDF